MRKEALKRKEKWCLWLCNADSWRWWNPKKYIATNIYLLSIRLFLKWWSLWESIIMLCLIRTFKATITSNGYNVTYNSLSTGEKKRIDFATVVSFIKLLKLSWEIWILFFLDEMLASIDINGVSDMMTILKDLSVELNMNIYLIHPCTGWECVFDNVIETSKPDGFSKITILN